MSDPVNTDELRERAEQIREHDSLGMLVTARLMEAAADEIDRLRESEHWRGMKLEGYERLLLKERATLRRIASADEIDNRED